MEKEQEMEIKKVPIMAVLLVGAFVAILNQTLLTTALPPIMNDLNIDANIAQWLTTIFMLVNGIMIPITAFLIETFTTRRLFISAIGLFAFGTFICALAPNFAILMTGRIIQAAGAGVMMPLMQTIVLLIFPIHKRGQAMGFMGLVISFAPAIGPTLAGIMVDHFHWRSLFYIVFPIAVIDIILAYFVLKNVTEQKFPKVDIPSIILSTFGFGGILYGFSSAGSLGWSHVAVITAIIVGIISLFFFSARQLRLEQPILELRVLKNRVFTLTTIIGMIVFIVMVGGATILPLYMQDMRGFTATESGLMMLPGALLMGLMSPVTGRIFDRIGAKWLMFVGLSLMAVSNILYTDLSHETSLIFMTVVYTLRMFSVSLVMMPITTAGLNALPRDLIPHGTAVNNTFRQVAGSIGTALLITIMTTVASLRSEATYAMIEGINVAFWVSFWLSVLSFILSFYVKKPKQT